MFFSIDRFRIAGRYLVCGGKAAAIAADWQPGRIVIVEFPSMEQMQNCFSSPEYAPLGAIRERATSSRGIVVEGYSGLYICISPGLAGIGLRDLFRRVSRSGRSW